MFNIQQIHGSKRSLRSVEDFTEFEQRTAYFNGDPIDAMKKGINILDRHPGQPHGADAEHARLSPGTQARPLTGRLDASKSSESELRGEKIFFGKGRCAGCHAPPSYLDHQMHDLMGVLEPQSSRRMPGDGPMKTFTLRGIKDSPPYLHDGRALTLEDTVEFFNLVMQLRLAPEEKDLVAFMRQL